MVREMARDLIDEMVRGKLVGSIGEPSYEGMRSMALASEMAMGENSTTSGEGGSGNDLASLSIMVQLVLLIMTFIIGHILRRRQILVISEAAAALLLGVLVGFTVTLHENAGGFRDWIDFNNEFFFYFLLPPIIFESGWSLRPKRFFANFGGILMFAIIGTAISAFVIAILMYFAGQSGHGIASLPFLECLVFGSLISATDPVTVLAIFQELGADPDLYALVFGESVLNDAVAIVLYRTVKEFLDTPVSDRRVLSAIWFFCVILMGSFAIGVIVSLVSALILKYGGFKQANLGVLEACIVSLFPYVAYMMADAAKLSGIVAILFAGITMRHYTNPNLSKEGQKITTTFFAMMAKLAETFIFIYMGLAVFVESHTWSSYKFALCSIAVTLLARVFNIYPLSSIVNLFREKSQRIPMTHQHALWFSGLRGALAFALSVQSITDLADGHGKVLNTATLIMVLFTVVFIGGGTPATLKVLKIQCGIPHHEREELATETENGGGGGGPPHPGGGPEGPGGGGPGGHPRSSLNWRRTSGVSEDGGGVFEKQDEAEDIFHKKPFERQRVNMKKRMRKLKSEARKLKKDASFTSLDKKYLKPFFISSQRPLLGPHSGPEAQNHQDSIHASVGSGQGHSRKGEGNQGPITDWILEGLGCPGPNLGGRDGAQDSPKGPETELSLPSGLTQHKKIVGGIPQTAEPEHTHLDKLRGGEDVVLTVGERGEGGGSSRVKKGDFGGSTAK